MEGCEFWLEQLSARLDGELTSEEERELERHLVQCPDCRALSEQLEALSAGLQDLEEIPAPEGFVQGVMERIAGEKKVIPLFRRPQVRALAGLAACAVLCIGLYGAGKWNSGRQEMALNADLSVGAYSASSDQASVPGEIAQRDTSLFKNDRDGASSAQGQEGPAVQSAAAGLEDQTVLILDAMPEGADSLLPRDTPVSYSEEYGGEVYSSLTLEQLDALETLAREQGITAARSAGAEGSDPCAVVLTGK